MATSVLEARSGVVPGVVASDRTPGAAPTPLRRVPLTALVAGALGVVEGVALLAVALTGLDGLLAAPSRLGGVLALAGLLTLAGWIVLAAGTGVALIDGTGRRGYVALALVETGLVAGFALLALTTSVAADLALPMPLLDIVLPAMALPVTKLLLAGAPSARRWVRQGPRVRETVPDPVAAHRLLATLTLGFIGTALVALTVLAPVDGEAADVGGTVSDVASRP